MTKTTACLAFAALVFLASGGAKAADLAPGYFDQHPAFAKTESGPLYVGFGGGWVFANELTASASGRFAGIAFDATADLSFEPGYEVGGVVGYQINPYFAIEGDFGYARFDMKTLDASLTVPGLGSASGKFDVGGTVEAVTGFANAIVTPVGVGFLTPYFGGGIGAAHLNTSFDSIKVLGAKIDLDGSESQTDLALQAIVGIDVALSHRFALGARYTYVWVDTAESKSASSGCFCGYEVKGEVDDFTASTLMLTGTLVF